MTLARVWVDAARVPSADARPPARQTLTADRTAVSLIQAAANNLNGADTAIEARACVVGIAMVAMVVAACTAAPDASGPAATAAPPSATPAADAPAAQRPTSWSGIRRAAGGVEIVRDGEVIAAERLEGATAAQTAYTDVDHGKPVLWSTCCEPVTGTTRSQGDLSEYGAQVDRVASAMVRVSADGTVVVRTGDHEDVVAFAGILDAAVVGERVVGLRDFEQVPDPAQDEQSTGLTLVHISRDAAVTDVAGLARAACAITRYGDDAVAVLQPPPGGAARPHACRGTRLTVLDAATGEPRKRLTLEEPIVHLSADDSGLWLIVTLASGAVDWIGVDGTTGRLAGAGYIRADW